MEHCRWLVENVMDRDRVISAKVYVINVMELRVEIVILVLSIMGEKDVQIVMAQGSCVKIYD